MSATYEPIATTTFGSNTASYTFTSIPSTYTDLILVMNGKTTSGEGAFILRVGNGTIDSGSNYSYQYIFGNGSSVVSARSSSQTSGSVGRYDTNGGIGLVQFSNYANTNVFKTILSRGGSGSLVQATVNLWRSTAAINQIYIQPETATNMATGYTLTLYGIKAE
jgi:hypothetical protein